MHAHNYTRTFIVLQCRELAQWYSQDILVPAKGSGQELLRVANVTMIYKTAHWDFTKTPTSQRLQQSNANFLCQRWRGDWRVTQDSSNISSRNDNDLVKAHPRALTTPGWKPLPVPDWANERPETGDLGPWAPLSEDPIDQARQPEATWLPCTSAVRRVSMEANAAAAFHARAFLSRIKELLWRRPCETTPQVPVFNQNTAACGPVLLAVGWSSGFKRPGGQGEPLVLFLVHTSSARHAPPTATLQQQCPWRH